MGEEVAVFVAVLVAVLEGVLVGVAVNVFVIQPEILVVTALEVTGAAMEVELMTASLVMGAPQAPTRPHQ